MRAPAWLVLVVLLVAGCTTPAAEQDPPEQVEPLQEDDAPAATPGAAPTPAPSTAPTSSPSPGPSSGPSPTPSPSPSAPQPGTEPSEPREPQPFEPEGATAPCDSLELRSPLVTSPTGAATGWPMLVLDLAILADPAFVAAHPEDWRQLLDALARDAAARYEPQLGLTFRVTLIDALPEGTIDPSFTETQIIPVARGYMNANHPNVAHDLVATVLGADYAGTVAGMADCVGGAYTPDTGYFWAEYTEDRNAAAFGVLFRDTPLKVFMHEAAHLLGAHHHYSNCGEAAVEYSPDDASAVCDVMINDIGFASYRFSPTNRLVMRSFVEEWRLGEAPA